MQNMANATFADTVQGMADVLGDSGLQLLLANTNYSRALEQRAIRSFVGWHPSALILTRHDHGEETEALLRRLDIPIVETWDLGQGRPFHQVGFSHVQVGFEQATYFIDQGARRIRFAISASPEDFRARQRADGYADVMRDRGLHVDVYQSTLRESFAAGAQVMAHFAGEPAATRPQAIVFANDEMAAGAILHAPACSLLLPRDCAVCGFGDAPLAAHLHPGLTTMRPDRYAIGRIAAALVLELIALGAQEHKLPPRSVSVPCQRVERESGRWVPTV
jgi:LacI family gluconate utilization system Gnt-I transcriptional repressor